MKKGSRGITLIALVITIIVLLILAGITINITVGQRGILARAQEAKIETRAGKVEEERDLWIMDREIAKSIGKTLISMEEKLTELEARRFTNTRRSRNNKSR